MPQLERCSRWGEGKNFFLGALTILTTRFGLILTFEFESAHEILMNLNSTFAKSMNLNLVFSKSMNLNLVFSKSMNLNLNLKIKNKINGSNQCRT